VCEVLLLAVIFWANPKIVRPRRGALLKRNEEKEAAEEEEEENQ